MVGCLEHVVLIGRPDGQPKGNGFFKKSLSLLLVALENGQKFLNADGVSFVDVVHIGRHDRPLFGIERGSLTFF